MFYTNGYIVKDTAVNKDFFNHPEYKGLESHNNWPLSNMNDHESKDLTNIIDDHFTKNNYIEIISNTNLLKKYVDHCKKLGIEIIILKIMTQKRSVIADKDLADIEVLGYDCIAGDSVSYLAEIFNNDNEIALYKNTISKINSNGLLNTYKEATHFIAERNKLVKQGINIEDYWDAFPAKLSIVQI